MSGSRKRYFFTDQLTFIPDATSAKHVINTLKNIDVSNHKSLFSDHVFYPLYYLTPELRQIAL